MNEDQTQKCKEAMAFVLQAFEIEVSDDSLSGDDYKVELSNPERKLNGSQPIRSSRNARQNKRRSGGEY